PGRHEALEPRPPPSKRLRAAGRSIVVGDRAAVLVRASPSAEIQPRAAGNENPGVMDPTEFTRVGSEIVNQLGLGRRLGEIVTVERAAGITGHVDFTPPRGTDRVADVGRVLLHRGSRLAREVPEEAAIILRL